MIEALQVGSRLHIRRSTVVGRVDLGCIHLSKQEMHRLAFFAEQARLLRVLATAEELEALLVENEDGDCAECGAPMSDHEDDCTTGILQQLLTTAQTVSRMGGVNIRLENQ